MSMRPFKAMVAKDLRLFLSDRRAVTLSFVAPLALASIFSMLGTGGTEGRSRIPVAVVDLDRSPLSQRVVSGLTDDANLEVRALIAAEDARAQVRQGKVGVAVVVPSEFGRTAARGLFRAGDRPEIVFLTDPTHAAEAGMVRGILMQHAMRVVMRDAFTGEGGLEALQSVEEQISGAFGIPEPLRLALQAMFRDIRKVREETAATGAPDEAIGGGGDDDGFGFGAPFVVTREVVQAGGDSDRGAMAAHAFAGMAVQFILFASVEAGVGLLTERQRGLWRRLRSSPVSRATLLGSRAVSQAMIAFTTFLVLYAFGWLVFGVRILGSPLAFVLTALAYSLTAATFGLLIAALGKTPQAARGVSVLAVLLLVLLGGAWVPMFLFPGWVRIVTLGIPTRWAVDGLEGATWRGLGFFELLPGVLALLGFATVFGALAVARFRWEED